MSKVVKKNFWMCCLFVFCGVIIGSVVGRILADVIHNDLFTKSFVFGTRGTPAVIDLLILQLQLGITVTVNFGTALGVALGIFIFTRM